jgi:hypothetical protein
MKGANLVMRFFWTITIKTGAPDRARFRRRGYSRIGEQVDLFHQGVRDFTVALFRRKADPPNAEVRIKERRFVTADLWRAVANRPSLSAGANAARKSLSPATGGGNSRELRWLI